MVSRPAPPAVVSLKVDLRRPWGLPPVLAVTVAGEPIGIQLVAGYGREDLLVQVAGQLEDFRPWAHRHPSLPGSPG